MTRQASDPSESSGEGESLVQSKVTVRLGKKAASSQWGTTAAVSVAVFAVLLPSVLGGALHTHPCTRTGVCLLLSDKEYLCTSLSPAWDAADHLDPEFLKDSFQIRLSIPLCSIFILFQFCFLGNLLLICTGQIRYSRKFSPSCFKEQIIIFNLNVCRFFLRFSRQIPIKTWLWIEKNF